MSQQLVKKGTNGKHENVMPKSWIEAIKDKNTGKTLVEILQGFNMYFLPYNGNTSSTRCLVPTILRKKGLWITYVKYDNNVYTEWYAADEIDDKSWGDSSNWRIGNNTLVGDITISANGNWVINGIETEFKAVGENGNTPLIRVANNRLQVSYDLGDTYIDVTNNPVYTKFRWLATSGDTQANNVGRIQASTDEGKTWTNMSNDFTNNLHIKKYIGVNESLPTSGIAEGTIYAKGPYYAEDDTLNDNPIYRLWVYAWKGDTLAWQDNGEFNSIAAGVVQETGNSENVVMSQKAVSEKFKELGSEVGLNKSLELNAIINSAGNWATNRHSCYYHCNEGTKYKVRKGDGKINLTFISEFPNPQNNQSAYKVGDNIVSDSDLDVVTPVSAKYAVFVDEDNYTAPKSFVLVSSLREYVDSNIETINFNNVFSWNNGKPLTLNNTYNGIKRSEYYQSVLSAKFVNCDSSVKRTIYVFWNNRIVDNSGLFSFRTSRYDSTEGKWVQEFVKTVPQSEINPSDDGLISIEIFDGNKKAVFLIDTSKIPLGDSSVFNQLTAEPELIFSKTCYENVSNSKLCNITKLYPYTKLPVISFQFDDIVDNDQKVYDLFKEYGLTCGFAFMASDEKLLKYKAKYLAWQSEGFSIFNHSINGAKFDSSTYTYDSALATILEAKHKLEKEGFIVNGWVSPSSYLNPAFLPIIKLAHAYGFTYKDEFENGRNSNPCTLTRFSMESNSLSDCKKHINECIAEDKLLTLYGHSANFGSTNQTSGEVWDVDKLKNILDYCMTMRNQGNCVIYNTDDAIKYYFEL